MTVEKSNRTWIIGIIIKSLFYVICIMYHIFYWCMCLLHKNVWRCCTLIAVSNLTEWLSIIISIHRKYIYITTIVLCSSSLQERKILVLVLLIVRKMERRKTEEEWIINELFVGCMNSLEKLQTYNSHESLFLIKVSKMLYLLLFD